MVLYVLQFKRTGGLRLLDETKANDMILQEKSAETESFKKLLVLLAVAVIAATVITELLFYIYFGLSGFFSISTEPVSPDVSFFLMWFRNHLMIFTPALLIFGLAFEKKAKTYTPAVSYEFKLSWIAPIFIASFALSMTSSGISHFIAELFGGGLPNIFVNSMPQSASQIVTMVVLVGFFGPVCEELIFRRWLLVPLRRYGDTQAVVITALLFGLYHGNLTQLLYTTTGGLLYGIVAVRANSVKPAIALHVINNLFEIIRSRVDTAARTTEIPAIVALSDIIPLAMILWGVVFFGYFISKGYFKTDNHNPYLSARERIRLVLGNLHIVLMLIVLIAVIILRSL
jgi:membrane protease YdiL (CAAX protease family)